MADQLQNLPYPPITLNHITDKKLDILNPVIDTCQLIH